MTERPINARDKRTFIETIRQAHLGTREAQYEVGLMYANGVGTAQNLSLAISWVAKAAARGLPAAQYLLATRYAMGIVVERDERVALDWYTKAAQQGHVKAIFALGRFFAEPHPDLSNSHMEMAARAGLADAQYAWAMALAQDTTASHDKQQIAAWLLAAAQQGHAKAQVTLAKAYETGDGVALDLGEARDWLRAAVRQNSPLAYVALAKLDAQGGRGAVKRSSPRNRLAERRQPKDAWEQVNAGLDVAESFALGAMFENGYGVDLDFGMAEWHYRNAAERGLPSAQCALASLLASDRRTEALQWAERAARTGDLQAKCLAGKLHLDGLQAGMGDALPALSWLGQAACAGQPGGAAGLLRILNNHEDALEIECIAKEAAGGDAQAQFEYGKRLENGRGTTRNMADGARWMLMAAEGGCAQAQIHLALSILSSESNEVRVAKAAQWMEKAALQGNHLAQWHLGGLFAKGAAGVEQDLKQAFYWCRMAANGGFVPAQATIGYLYSRIDDENSARHWLEKAAKGGDAEAQFNFALLISKPDASDALLEVAADWLLAAAAQGLAVAQTELGLRYVKGVGVFADPIEAHKWFILAAEQQEPAAAADLQLSESRLNEIQMREAVRRANAQGLRVAS